jgi:hypothetical protein
MMINIYIYINNDNHIIIIIIIYSSWVVAQTSNIVVNECFIYFSCIIIVICDFCATCYQSQTWVTKTIYTMYTIICIQVHLWTNMQL